jgi:acyl-CoA reductase-like NAD-dependent aldehyde dehydrogenase
MVGMNSGLISNEAAPFGDIEHSGSGRERPRYRMDEFLALHYLCLRLWRFPYYYYYCGDFVHECL